MSADLLTPEARHENATALASAMGISLPDAAEALAFGVRITADSKDAMAESLASEISGLLARTVNHVSRLHDGNAVAAELVIGSAKPRTSAPTTYLSVLNDQAILSHRRTARDACHPAPRILSLITACYACAAILHRVLGEALPFGPPEPAILRYDQFGIDWTSVQRPVEIGRTYLAGAGAIGNGFLWAARHLDLRGQLDIVDDDFVSSGNLNRQVWFDRMDIGHAKAIRLAEKAQHQFPGLTLLPRLCRLQDLPEKTDDAWLRRLIVAVDSRRARRALQNEFPGEVFDASTTDIREVVVHHNVQPTTLACLSCIYERNDEELSREQHIADHLGVTVDEVRAERISPSAASFIVARFPKLLAADLIGTAYDTLFKALCGEGQLHTTTGRAVAAPFGFVSVLAGTLLALEVVRRVGVGHHVRDFNYWRVSPWYPPNARGRKLRQKQSNCMFCGDDLLREVNNGLWLRQGPDCSHST